MNMMRKREESPSFLFSCLAQGRHTPCFASRVLYSLKRVWLILPSAVELQPHLDAAENHLLSSFKVDAQLDNVTVVDGERLALLGGRAQADVVEERARRALDVLDVPFAVFVPELAVPAADHLALKAHWRCRGLIAGHAGQGMAVTLRVSADANDLGAAGQRPGDGREGQRRSGGSRVVVGGEADRGLAVGRAGGLVGSGHGWVLVDARGRLGSRRRR